MKTITRDTGAKLFFLSALTTLTACTAGTVYDTTGAGLAGAEVVAYGRCSGVGCDGAEVETVTPGGNLTGYQAVADEAGRYFFDPYGEVVPPGEVMFVRPQNGDSTYQLQYSKPGFRDVWLDFTPVFEEYSYEGSNYYIAGVPDVHLCADEEPDTDGDGICDAAEPFYGMSADSADTDGDGDFDDQEVFGSGSPFEVQTRKFLHFNINVSDLAASKAFYELLGFNQLIQTSINVTDPDEAQGLDLPPYSLDVAVLALGDGFLIDLIRFTSPFDDAPPNTGDAVGMTNLQMQTENLAADMAVLDAAGVDYWVTSSEEDEPLSIKTYDPDGVKIHLSQSGPVNPAPNYKHSISGPTIYVSDLEASLAFYEQAGFHVGETGEGWAGIYLSNLRSAKLVETDNESPAYANVNHLGIARVAVETTNIDRDIEILQAAGVDFYTDEAVLPTGVFAFLRYVCFEDPDGTVIELVEYNN